MMSFDEAIEKDFCRKCDRRGKPFKAHWSPPFPHQEFTDGSHVEHLTWVCKCGYQFWSHPADAAQAAA